MSSELREQAFQDTKSYAGETPKPKPSRGKASRKADGELWWAKTPRYMLFDPRLTKTSVATGVSQGDAYYVWSFVCDAAAGHPADDGTYEVDVKLIARQTGRTVSKVSAILDAFEKNGLTRDGVCLTFIPRKERSPGAIRTDKWRKNKPKTVQSGSDRLRAVGKGAATRSQGEALPEASHVTDEASLVTDRGCLRTEDSSLASPTNEIDERASPAGTPALPASPSSSSSASARSGGGNGIGSARSDPPASAKIVPFPLKPIAKPSPKWGEKSFKDDYLQAFNDFNYVEKHCRDIAGHLGWSVAVKSMKPVMDMMIADPMLVPVDLLNGFNDLVFKTRKKDLECGRRPFRPTGWYCLDKWVCEAARQRIEAEWSDEN